MKVRLSLILSLLVIASVSIHAQEIRERQITPAYDLATMQSPVEIVSIKLNGKDILPGEKIEGTQPKAQKFDEFTGEADYEHLMARLDNFLIELQQQPNAQGHIIVYRSRRDSAAVSNRYALRAKDYLVRVRRGDAARIQTFDGGRTGCLTYELWIVPPGAEPPPRRFTYKYPLKGSRR